LFIVKHLSLFLDLDGTIIDLAEHPDAVSIPAQLPSVLQRLDTKLGGALAMASGRNIEVLDRLLFPYRGCAIGVHGTERRLHGNAVVNHLLAPLPAALRAAVEDIARQHPGAFIEDKGSAIAVHERGDALMAQALTDRLQEICAQYGTAWQCLPGRRVIEIKPAGVDKGTGIEWMMQQAAFTVTSPVAVGDDITDLDMFDAVTRFGGLTVAVGERIADDGHVHLHSPAAVLRFLEKWSVSTGGETLAQVESLARQAESA
jgi:trehalose 6-phosphate phosphatase